MEPSKSDIALLYFSRQAEAEQRAKPWMKGHKNPNSVASSLIRQSSRLLANANLPVFHFHEGNQVGGNFGERIAHAFHTIFAQGYRGVIAVGNDTPGLTQGHLTEAHEALSLGHSILGPSRNKGAYLIGMTSDQFDVETFSQLPWQSNKLFDTLQDFCRQNQVCSLLPCLQDLNSFSDLKQLILHKEVPVGYARLLLFLASAQETTHPIERKTNSNTINLSQHRRGPPALLAA
ncbi:MAG: hypothetical protein ACI92W_001121 [Paraglaciecola sp.]|jgi:hypothetical protein